MASNGGGVVGAATHLRLKTTASGGYPLAGPRGPRQRGAETQDSQAGVGGSRAPPRTWSLPTVLAAAGDTWKPGTDGAQTPRTGAAAESLSCSLIHRRPAGLTAVNATRRYQVVKPPSYPPVTGSCAAASARPPWPTASRSGRPPPLPHTAPRYRIRHLRAQRLIPQPVPELQLHQPQIRLHRRRAPTHPRVEERHERREERRIVQQCVDAGQAPRAAGATPVEEPTPTTADHPRVGNTMASIPYSPRVEAILAVKAPDPGDRRAGTFSGRSS